MDRGIGGLRVAPPHALGVAMMSGVLFQAIAVSRGTWRRYFLRSDMPACAKLSERIDAHAAVRTLT